MHDVFDKVIGCESQCSVERHGYHGTVCIILVHPLQVAGFLPHSVKTCELGTPVINFERRLEIVGHIGGLVSILRPYDLHMRLIQLNAVSVELFVFPVYIPICIGWSHALFIGVFTLERSVYLLHVFFMLWAEGQQLAFPWGRGLPHLSFHTGTALCFNFGTGRAASVHAGVYCSVNDVTLTSTLRRDSPRRCFTVSLDAGRPATSQVLPLALI